MSLRNRGKNPTRPNTKTEMCISPFDWAIVVVTTQRVDWINDEYKF